MPDIVVHHSMGGKVLESLDTEILSCFDKEVFCFALMVPDLYSFYRFFARPFRNDIQKRSIVIHKKHINDFFLRLAQESGDCRVFSFLCGILCHFALDSITHPYINYLSANKQESHMAIEHRLDVIELERLGKTRKDVMNLFPNYIELEVVKEAFRDIYGWDDRLLRTSYKHMKWFYQIAIDQTGILNAVFHRKKGLMSVISYQSTYCEGMDFSWFPPLEEQAVEYCVQLISSVFRYIKREESLDAFKEKIGSKDYDGAMSS